MNTRFNPTANGNLHLGHIYLVLLNYYTAKKNNGKFIIRFDDDQAEWIQKIGKDKINQFCEEIKEDLSWLGIKPDLYSYESKEKTENEKFIKDIKNIHFSNTDTNYNESEVTLPNIKNIDRPYPYVPYLTCIKVIQDWRENCSIIIRGEDLVSEFSLYCYFCKCLGIPVPKFYFVPKLMLIKKNNLDPENYLSDLSDISKTQGNFKLRDLKKKGYTPKQIMDFLENICLIDKKKGWCYENIKKNPVIDYENNYF